MTGPRGGTTTFTPGGLYKATVTFREGDLARIDSERARLAAAGQQASRAEVLRQLVQRLLPPAPDLKSVT